MTLLHSAGKDGKGKGKGKEDPDAPPKEQPNFEPSGLLALEDNSKNGIPLKFTVPAEARRPSIKWRLYIFVKQNEDPKIIQIHKNAAGWWVQAFLFNWQTGAIYFCCKL